VSRLEQRTEVGVGPDSLRLHQLDGAPEQRFVGDITANECQRGELLQRA